jgi:hypothetical protein
VKVVLFPSLFGYFTGVLREQTLTFGQFSVMAEDERVE